MADTASRGSEAVASAASARETRWGAAALAIGATLFVLGTVMGLEAFEGEWDTSIGPRHHGR